MTIPAVGPTGAMTGGAYVTYMIDYFLTALTSLETQLDTYLVNQITTDWDNKWDQLMDDVETDTVVLHADISGVQSQIMMIRNAVAAL